VSGKLMGETWSYELRLEGVDEATARLVLLALCDHADPEGRNVRPSIGLLAWKLGVHERTIQRAIAALVDRGVLHLVRKSGPRRATEYRVVLRVLKRKPPRPPKDGAAPPTKDGAAPPKKGDSESPMGDSERPMGDMATPPEPSTEPSTEPSVLDDDEIKDDVAVAQALAELRDLGAYPFDTLRDTQLLTSIHERRPRVALAQEIERWSERRNGIRNQRAALAVWLERAEDAPPGQLDRPCNVPGCNSRGVGSGLCIRHHVDVGTLPRSVLEATRPA
jgi:DNA-binding transcriptional ArsR family regulator